MLASEGDEADLAFLIINGEVELSKKVHKQKTKPDPSLLFYKKPQIENMNFKKNVYETRKVQVGKFR